MWSLPGGSAEGRRPVWAVVLGLVRVEENIFVLACESYFLFFALFWDLLEVFASMVNPSISFQSEHVVSIKCRLELELIHRLNKIRRKYNIHV